MKSPTIESWSGMGFLDILFVLIPVFMKDISKHKHPC